MSVTIQERLRMMVALKHSHPQFGEYVDIASEAADEIDRLERKLAATRGEVSFKDTRIDELERALAEAKGLIANFVEATDHIGSSVYDWERVIEELREQAVGGDDE